MEKVIFFSMPLSGHVNPEIELCRQLSLKNVEIVYYTSKSHFKKFEGINNIKLKEYPEDFQQYFDYIGNKREIHHKMLRMLSVFYEDTEMLMDFCVKELERESPNVVVCDQFAIWGKAASRYHKLPISLFFSSIMGDEVVNRNDPFLKQAVLYMILTQGIYMIKILQIIRRINKKYGKVVDDIGSLMSHGGNFSMVMTSREFHPGGIEYDSNVKFIGADHVPKVEISNKKDTIFITLGTISLRKSFFEDCIAATKDLGYKIVITLAGNEQHDITAIKKLENVVVYNNLSFNEFRDVMNRSVLFISHGGFNGVTTSILYRTPLIICPSSPEQINNAKLITKYQCGKGYYKKKIDVSKFKELIMNVIGNEEIKKGLQFHSDALINSLGYEKVAEEMCKQFNLSEIKNANVT